MSKSLMSMTRRDAESAIYSSMRDANTYLKAQREEAKKKKPITQIGREALGVLLGAGGIGWLAGLTESTSIGQTGIPTGLAAGGALHLLAYFDVLGPSLSEDLHNVANGAVAGWGALWAAGHGTNARLKAGETVTAISAGVTHAPNQLPMPRVPEARHAKPLNEAEIAAVHAGMRR